MSFHAPRAAPHRLASKTYKERQADRTPVLLMFTVTQ